MNLTDAELSGEKGAEVCTLLSNASRSTDGWSGGRTETQQTKHSKILMAESRW